MRRRKSKGFPLFLSVASVAMLAIGFLFLHLAQTSQEDSLVASILALLAFSLAIALWIVVMRIVLLIRKQRGLQGRE